MGETDGKWPTVRRLDRAILVLILAAVLAWVIFGGVVLWG